VTCGAGVSGGACVVGGSPGCGSRIVAGRSTGCAGSGSRLSVQGGPGVRADDAVRRQVLFLLESLDDRVRLRAEVAVDVHGMPPVGEHRLEVLDPVGVGLIALVQYRFAGHDASRAA
jgi:hypothetical protein